MTGEREAELTAIREQLRRIEDILLSGEHSDNPVSPKCEAVMEASPKCYDFRGIRRWAACRAWEIMEEEKVPWAESISRAWDEAKAKCEWA